MRRPLPRAAVAAAAGVLAFAACEPSPTAPVEVESAPSLIPKTAVADGRIAFVSDTEIWVVNPDGSGVTNLSNNGPLSDEDPAWSPDGRRIAFARTGNIWVMNGDGTSQTRLTTERFDMDPSWSPDGTRIAFVNANSDGTAIHVVNTDGSGRTRLTDHTAKDFQPAWSPDGRKIAFMRSDDVWVMSADGTGLTNLTPGTPDEDEEPSWSPDGSRIAFVSDRDGSQSLYVMNAEGTGPVPVHACLVFCSHPSWSPDGTRLAFAGTTSPFFFPINPGDVLVLDLASGGVTSLTIDRTHFDLAPAWGVTPTRTISERIVLLALDVVHLRQAGVMNHGQALALNLKLKIALEAWRARDRGRAVVSMGVFARHVSGLIQGGVLTMDEGLPLIEQVVEIVHEVVGSGQPAGYSGDG